MVLWQSNGATLLRISSGGARGLQIFVDFAATTTTSLWLALSSHVGPLSRPGELYGSVFGVIKVPLITNAADVVAQVANQAFPNILSITSSQTTSAKIRTGQSSLLAGTGFVVMHAMHGSPTMLGRLGWLCLTNLTNLLVTHLDFLAPRGFLLASNAVSCGAGDRILTHMKCFVSCVLQSFGALESSGLGSQEILTMGSTCLNGASQAWHVPKQRQLAASSWADVWSSCGPWQVHRPAEGCDVLVDRGWLTKILPGACTFKYIQFYSSV